MRTIDTYLDRARERTGLKSDRELAERLGQSHSTVTHYRCKRTWPSPRTMVRIAELAGMDAGVAILELCVWQNESAEVRRAVVPLIEMVLKHVAAVLIVLATIVGTQPAQAVTIAPELYIMRLWRRLTSAWRARFLNTSLSLGLI